MPKVVEAMFSDLLALQECWIADEIDWAFEELVLKNRSSAFKPISKEFVERLYNLRPDSREYQDFLRLREAGGVERLGDLDESGRHSRGTSLRIAGHHTHVYGDALSVSHSNLQAAEPLCSSCRRTQTRPCCMCCHRSECLRNPGFAHREAAVMREPGFYSFTY